jgi:hypothetical protein
MGGAAQDQYGNALGGLRLPVVDVPVAQYDATTCGLYGQTITLDPATLRETYPTHEAYVEQMQQATDVAIANGYLLPADGEDLMARARASPIGVWGEAD